MDINLLKEKIFCEIKENAEKFRNWNYKELHYHCFKSPAGYRLTHEGLQELTHLYDTYEFKIDARITSRNLITLTREVDYPYYISKNRLVLFGGQDAFMLKIYAGDVHEWLDRISKT